MAFSCPNSWARQRKYQRQPLALALSVPRLTYFCLNKPVNTTTNCLHLFICMSTSAPADSLSTHSSVMCTILTLPLSVSPAQICKKPPDKRFPSGTVFTYCEGKDWTLEYHEDKHSTEAPTVPHSETQAKTFINCPASKESVDSQKCWRVTMTTDDVMTIKNQTGVQTCVCVFVSLLKWLTMTGIVDSVGKQRWVVTTDLLKDYQHEADRLHHLTQIHPSERKQVDVSWLSSVETPEGSSWKTKTKRHSKYLKSKLSLTLSYWLERLIS